jgi:hypothetical protein
VETHKTRDEIRELRKARQQRTKPKVRSLTQAELETRRAKSQRRIELAQKNKARTERLIDWLAFFRLPGEIGIGDTARRLNMQSCKSPDAHELLTRLLKQCSCTPADAVARLNKEHTYPAKTLNLGGS